MQLFEGIVRELRAYVDGVRASRGLREVRCPEAAAWPAGRRGNVVLEPDTAVELGSPKDASVAFLVLTTELSLVRDAYVTLVGPDVGESLGRHLPFGKVVMLGVTGVTEEECYERHREIDRVRYDLNLSGYMMRAASQHGREWSRVSRQAVETGFSLITLGSALIRLYRSMPRVACAEILLVTSPAEDVRALETIGRKASRQIEAMSKMATEVSRECDACGFSDVCSQVDGLRAMRSASKEGRRHV